LRAGWIDFEEPLVKKLVCAVSILATVVAATTLAAPASAENYIASLNVLGGAGGSLDGEPSSGFGNRSLELGLGMPIEPSTLVVVRGGEIDLSHRSSFEGLTGAKLQYATVSGEYRFSETYYVPGLFLGVGAYRLRGNAAGRSDDTTQVGVTLGVDGEFQITRRLAFVIQASGHYAAFSGRAQMYANAQAGLAFHF
jgi:hypothetical protein